MARVVRLPMCYVSGFLGVSRQDIERIEKAHGGLPANGRIEGDDLVFDRERFDSRIVAWLQDNAEYLG